MNKLYRLPLRTRAKNLSSGIRRRQYSSKILAIVILALCGLAALVAIGFAAYLTYKNVAPKSEAPLATNPSPRATPSPAPTAAKPNDELMPLSDPNKALSEGTPSANAAASQQPSPPVLVSMPTPTPAASAAQNGPQTGSEPKETQKPLTRAARKSLEKKRSEAEHKRARLERQFQNHEISAEAYNKGKEEYKEEIQKYRESLKAGE
jgi:flagellar biosynthesis GTPase FlhF